MSTGTSPSSMIHWRPRKSALCDLLLGRRLLTEGPLGRFAECLVIKAVWRSRACCSKQQQCLQGTTLAWLLSCTVWTCLGQYIWRTFIEVAFTYRQEIVAPISPANNTNPIRTIPGSFFYTPTLLSRIEMWPLRIHKGFIRNLNCPSASGHFKKCTSQQLHLVLFPANHF